MPSREEIAKEIAMIHIRGSIVEKADPNYYKYAYPDYLPIADYVLSEIKKAKQEGRKEAAREMRGQGFLDPSEPKSYREMQGKINRICDSILAEEE